LELEVLDTVASPKGERYAFATALMRSMVLVVL
jgi:hypothetical protein